MADGDAANQQDGSGAPASVQLARLWTMGIGIRRIAEAADETGLCFDGWESDSVGKASSWQRVVMARSSLVIST
jgi:hypothetical protein